MKKDQENISLSFLASDMFHELGEFLVCILSAAAIGIAAIAVFGGG